MTTNQAVSWLSQPGIMAMMPDPTTRKALNVAIEALDKAEATWILLREEHAKRTIDPETGLATWVVEIGEPRMIKGNPIYCCSNCFTASLSKQKQLTVVHTDILPYCPFCGAKMRRR